MSNTKVELLVMHGSSIDHVPIDMTHSIGIRFEFVNWRSPNTVITIKIDEENNALDIYSDLSLLITPKAANRVKIQDNG